MIDRLLIGIDVAHELLNNPSIFWQSETLRYVVIMALVETGVVIAGLWRRRQESKAAKGVSETTEQAKALAAA